jgi:ATP-dependent helicase/nuclease subunit A
MESRIATILEKLCLNEDGFREHYLLKIIGISSLDDKILRLTERLFFEFQSDLHNVKIMTLHSFCQDLLSRFPLEAGLNADFEIIDENDAMELMKIAKRRAFESLEETDIEAVRVLAGLISGYTLEDLVNKVLIAPAKLIDFFEANRNLGDYEQKLESIFNLGEFTEFPKEFSDYISSFFKDKDLEKVLLTSAGAIRKRLSNTEDMIAQIVLENNIFKKKKTLIRKIIAFLKIIRRILDEYQNLKKRNNVIDFDEILHATDCLLTKSYAKEFVMSRLCESIKCIMIDEAQDLSQFQWKLISIFSEDILLDQATDKKTIFVVGDMKQSIYRFQGADCKSLSQFYESCARLLSSIGKRLNTVYLNTSYRSLPRILRVVDSIFEECNFWLDQAEYNAHAAHREDGDGIAEFVELIGENLSEQSDQISNYINMLSAEVPASEILILTRSRNEMSERVMESLSRTGLKIASSDRFNLSKNLLIMDVLSLSKFCINYDKYALFCVLKSPYIFEHPLSDDDLYCICHNDDILNNLKLNYHDKWRRIFNVMECYKSHKFVEFFYFILSEVVRKFNQEDEFVISAFMDIVISFSKRKSNIVSEFLDYLKITNIKISMQNLKKDGIRLSTIHGAKGLEAPVVCILDFKLKADKTKAKIIWNDNLFFLKPSKSNSFDEINSIVEDEYEEERKELFRLLYVAMTRARDRLYIFGKKDGDLWKIFNPIIGNDFQNSP